MRVLDADGEPLPVDTLAAMIRRRWGEGVPELRAGALAEIDQAAEIARSAFITVGAGQAMEYLATEAEARAFDAGAPGPFPFLAAERDAMGAGATLAQVSASVLAQADAWAGIGAAIKRIRRAAKMKVEAAQTVEEIAVALAEVEWPKP